MKQELSCQTPDDRKFLLKRAGVEILNTTYAFEVKPIPALSFAEDTAHNGNCTIEAMLASHKRFPTMEELAHIKDTLFHDFEAVVYKLYDAKSTTGVLPEMFRNREIDGEDLPVRPKVTMYQVPAAEVPDFRSLIQRLQFAGSSIIAKSRAIGGKTCKIVYSPNELNYGQLQKIAAEHFSDAIMFHTKAETIYNTNNLYFIWSAEDFPELEEFLK